MEVGSSAQLAEWIAEFPKYVHSREAFKVPAENCDDFLLLVGVALRIARNAEAYLVLVDSGHSLEATPLARAAFEHAVTLQWIFVTLTGPSRFRHQVDSDRVAFFKRLNQWLKSDDIAEGIQKIKAPMEGERLPSFMQIVARLDDREKTLKHLYDLLSQQIHITFGAVTESLEDIDDGRVGLVHGAQDAMRDGTLYSLSIACIWAWWVLAKLLDDEDALAQLDLDSDRLNIPTNLASNVRADQRRADL